MSDRSHLTDARAQAALARAMDGVDVVYYLAAHVAVTTSVVHPREDFEINTLSTLNVLEVALRARRPPVVVFTPTNKVYGHATRCPSGPSCRSTGAALRLPRDALSPVAAGRPEDVLR